MTMTHETYYDLDGHVCSLERAVDLLTDLSTRTISHCDLTFMGHHVYVSTVFLIVDHSHPPINGQPPALWGTEVFGGPDDIDASNAFYRSYEEAIQGHELMIERLITSGCRRL